MITKEEIFISTLFGLSIFISYVVIVVKILKYIFFIFDDGIPALFTDGTVF